MPIDKNIYKKAKETLIKKKTEPIRIAAAKKDMLHYARWIFEELYEIEFLESWYHELICKVLMAVIRGEVTRLIINIPPSYGKTEFAVKLFISWALGKYSHLRFIYASYSDDLATETPADVKNIIFSEPYEKVFGAKKLNKKADQKWYLDKNGGKDGGMFSTTILGGVTGFHCDVLIIDDPMKAIEKNTKSARDATISFYTSTAKTRLRKSNPNASIIIIMQRLHEKDLVGYLLDEEGDYWTHINLVGINEKKAITYEFQDFKYKRKINEPLNPHFEDIKALDEQKNTMKADWYSQYQQDPKTIETGYITDEDFATISSWEVPEENEAIFIDPAQSVKESADNRAVGVIGASLSKEKIELYTCHGFWYGVWSNKDFVEVIVQTMIKYPKIPVYIEDAGGGIITEQYLRTRIAEVNYELKLKGQEPISVGRIKMFTPPRKISKNQKIDNTTSYWKNHQIRFLVNANGIEQVKKEAKAFHPEKDSKEDDCIELVANAIMKLIPKKTAKKKKEGINMAKKRFPNQRTSRGWRV